MYSHMCGFLLQIQVLLLVDIQTVIALVCIIFMFASPLIAQQLHGHAWQLPQILRVSCRRACFTCCHAAADGWPKPSHSDMRIGTATRPHEQSKG